MKTARKLVQVGGRLAALALVLSACAAAPGQTPAQAAAREAAGKQQAAEFAQLLRQRVNQAKHHIAQLEAAEQAGEGALAAKDYPHAFEHYVNAVELAAGAAPGDWTLSKEEEKTRFAYTYGVGILQYHYVIERDEADYFRTLEALTEANAKEFPLRKGVVAAAGKLPSVPSVPEVARKHVVRAKAQLEASGIAAAAQEMDLALRAAPWWTDAYGQAGVIYERAERYRDAINSFELFLQAAPRSEHAQQIRDKIYELEVKKENYDRIQTMAGKWKDTIHDNAYTLRLDGDGVIFGNNQGWIVEGLLKDDHIDGTITFPARAGEGKYGICLIPKVTRELLSSSVSPDKQRIRVSFMYPHYRLYLNETFASISCRDVVFDHNETVEINIALEASTYEPE